MLRSDMLCMAWPCVMLGGFGGMPPPRNFFEMVHFGVYLDQILSLKFF